MNLGEQTCGLLVTTNEGISDVKVLYTNSEVSNGNEVCTKQSSHGVGSVGYVDTGNGVVVSIDHTREVAVEAAVKSPCLTLNHIRLIVNSTGLGRINVSPTKVDVIHDVNGLASKGSALAQFLTEGDEISLVVYVEIGLGCIIPRKNRVGYCLRSGHTVVSVDLEARAEVNSNVTRGEYQRLGGCINSCINVFAQRVSERATRLTSPRPVCKVFVISIIGVSDSTSHRSNCILVITGRSGCSNTDQKAVVVHQLSGNINSTCYDYFFDGNNRVVTTIGITNDNTNLTNVCAGHINRAVECASVNVNDTSHVSSLGAKHLTACQSDESTGSGVTPSLGSGASDGSVEDGSSDGNLVHNVSKESGCLNIGSGNGSANNSVHNNQFSCSRSSSDGSYVLATGNIDVKSQLVELCLAVAGDCSEQTSANSGGIRNGQVLYTNGSVCNSQQVTEDASGCGDTGNGVVATIDYTGEVSRGKVGPSLFGHVDVSGNANGLACKCFTVSQVLCKSQQRVSVGNGNNIFSSFISTCENGSEGGQSHYETQNQKSRYEFTLHKFTSLFLFF